jgi:hypothetical protein
MTRAQVENLVERGRASGRLVENLDVQGYSRAADWVYQHAPDYSGVPVAVLSEIQKFAVGLAWEVEPPPTREAPGEWRHGGIRIRSVQVPLPAMIPAELDAWSRSTGDLAGRHPVIHAAAHHAWLERIHPFVDGNGRTGRLVLNFMLLQHGYPPAVILTTQRRRYLRALEIADVGNPNALAEVIARAVHDALNRFLIPGLAGDARLVPLASLAAGTRYSPAYLRFLVHEGRLRAVRDGKLWLSSRAWLAEYRRSRDRRGTHRGDGVPEAAPRRSARGSA